MSADVKIRIDLPLPMDVAGTLMKLVGLAYPDALMEGNGRSMTFVLPEGTRPRKVAKTKAKAETVLDETTDLLEIGPDGISISTPEHLAAACLEIMKTSFEQYPDAKNYLEQKVYDRATHKHYAMTFQRVEGKSPAELRTQAEDALAVALARIAELEAPGE